MLPGNISESPRNVARTNGVSVPTSAAKVPRTGPFKGTVEITPKGGTIYFKKGSTYASGVEQTPTVSSSDFDDSQAVGAGPIVIRAFDSVPIWWAAASGGVTADVVEY